MEQELTSLIGTVGFPVAVTVFLLLERNKTLKGLITAINDLTLLIKSKIK